MNNALYHHIHTVGSMQAGSVDFVSNVLPVSTRSYSSISTEQPISSYKTNTTASSSSSSGYESVLSKPHKSLFYRLKRLINFPTTKKSADYQISSLNNSPDENHFNSPILSFRDPISSLGISNSNETRRNSFAHRKSSRRTLSSTIQHIPFLYGLKNCGNTW
jgi:hypothetical protein